MLQQIYPYLVQRANNRNWALTLINFVVQERGPLTDEQREEIKNMLLIENQYINGEIQNTIPLEVEDVITGSPVKLRKLSNPEGVNALSTGGEIIFGDNLTIVYGQNGSGKSGYCRILKSIAPYTHDQDKVVLGNMVSGNDEIEKKCSIEFQKDGNDEILEWTNSHEDQIPLAVFNSSCVSFSLGDNRTLLAQPEGFYLFDLVTSELEKLKYDLLSIKQTLSLNDPCPSLHDGTSIKRLHESISKDTEIEAINGITSDTINTVEDQIKNQKEQLTKLNIEFLRQNETIATQKSNNLQKILDSLNHNKGLFKKEARDLYMDNVKKLTHIEENKEVGIKNIGDLFGAEFTDRKEYKDLITVADNYIQLMSETYPNEGDKCVYCLQQLDSNAKDLLGQYKAKLQEIRNSGTGELMTSIQQYKGDLSTIQDTYDLSHSPFGTEIVDEETLCIVPQILKDTFDLLKKYKHHEEIFQREDIDFDGTIDLVNTQHQTLTKEMQDIESKITTLEPQKDGLQKEIDELEDKKTYIICKDQIITYITNIKQQHLLQSIIDTQLSQRSLSAKKLTAQNELITTDYNTKYADERRDLNCPDYVSYNLGITGGQNTLRQGISGISLDKILSEGEQKSIALAQFITEIKIAHLQIPLILDDPMTSLDHERMYNIAEKLLELSISNQIIIFTHDIVFFYILEDIYYTSYRNGDYDYKYYTVEYEEGMPGKVIPDHSPSIGNYNKYKRDIEDIIQKRTYIDCPESQKASIAYSKLRAMIEKVIEEKVFNGIVGRYRPNIMMTQLENINGAAIDANKSELFSIFRRCCRVTEAHDHTALGYVPPQLASLTHDYNRVKEIVALF